MTPRQERIVLWLIRWPLRLLFLPLMLFIRVKTRSPAFQAEIMARWYKPDETAPWFGQTGLPADIERELAPYLRRELGSDVHELPAASLIYHGQHRQEGFQVHYWWFPAVGVCEAGWATVSVAPDGSCSLGTDDQAPPTP